MLFECGVEAVSRTFRKRSGFGIAVNLDGFFCGVYDEPALLAFFEVLFDLRAKGGAEILVEIVLQLNNDCLAVH